MTDYELGRQIARKGNFLNPSAADEIRRGYVDELEACRRQIEECRRNQAQADIGNHQGK